MSPRIRRWSFLGGAVFAIVGFSLLAAPLASAPLASVAHVAASSPEDPCCRLDTGRREVALVPAMALLGAGGALMLAAGLASGGPYRRSAV